MTPRSVLPWWGSCERRSARTRYRLSDTEAWLLRGQLDAVGELDPRPRIVREQEVPVEVDVIAEAGHLRCGRDREAGLDHAPEHHAQAERTGGVRHAHALADP